MGGGEKLTSRSPGDHAVLKISKCTRTWRRVVRDNGILWGLNATIRPLVEATGCRERRGDAGSRREAEHGVVISVWRERERERERDDKRRGMNLR